MQVMEIAEQLKAAGIVVTKVTEGNDTEDGDLTVTEHVHVQVGEFGEYMNVVHQLDDETFEFYPEARNIAALVADIRKACGTVA